MSAQSDHKPDRAEFRLLACDLDGTLLHQGKLTKRAMDAIAAVHAAGCRVAISTGRAYATVPAKIRELPSVDAFINSNGASVTVDGKELSIKPMENAIARAVLQTMLEHGAAVNVFLNGTALFDRRFMRVAGRKEHGSIGHMLSMLFVMLPYFRSANSILWHTINKNAVVEKVGGVFPSATDAALVLDALQARADVTAVTTMGNDVEVTAKGVSKGKALSVLSAFYGIPREQVLVCGDSGNDLSMRDACGFFLAPDTATVDVLHVADAVTGGAAEDGVANWLLSRFGGNK